MPLFGSAQTQEELEGFDLAAETRIQRLRVEDGEVRGTFSLRDVMEANPGIDIFGVHQIDYDWGGSDWETDPFHLNDVEPLPAALAPAFPGFEAGDLLLSPRSLNLVAVVDPETLRIKWYDFGRMRRQHDPDWQPDGTITVFDNSMHRPPSRILRIRPGHGSAPETTVETIVNGADHGFYSAIRGKHQVLGNGDVLVTSSQQGRVFEVDGDGSVRFEFLNTYRGDFSTRFAVSEAIRLPLDHFEGGVLDRRCG
jgi:hypothetical protein